MTAFNSAEYARYASGTDYNYPIDQAGKLRILHFSFVAAAAGAGTDTLLLARIPPGRIRLLPWLSRLWHTAWGVGVTVNIGLGAYKAEGYADEAADPDALAAGVDISGAGSNVVLATTEKFDVFSMKGMDLYGTIAGGNVAISDGLSGYLAYLAE